MPLYQTLRPSLFQKDRKNIPVCPATDLYFPQWAIVLGKILSNILGCYQFYGKAPFFSFSGKGGFLYPNFLS